MKLDSVIMMLDAAEASRLEADVRARVLARREAKEWEQVMVLMQKNHPDIAPLIGAFADIEFEVAEDPAPEPLTNW